MVLKTSEAVFYTKNSPDRRGLIAFEEWAKFISLLKAVPKAVTILPKAVVIISQPIVSTDDARASLTARHLIDKVAILNCIVMNNSNINYDHLGNKELHLNGRGTRRLAMNIISLIKQL